MSARGYGWPASKPEMTTSLGGVRCPFCGGSTGVTDSRPADTSVRRRRACIDCDGRFTTHEMIGESPDAIMAAAAKAAAQLRGLANQLDIMACPPPPVSEPLSTDAFAPRRTGKAA